MQTPSVESMPVTFEDGWDEEWEVVLNTGGKYTLNRKQAWVVQEAIATSNRGILMFKTFSISMPYIAELYRIRRFMSDQVSLPERASEEVWTEEDRLRAIARMKEIREKFGKLNK